MWRDLSWDDKKLIGRLSVIAAVSVIALVIAGRHVERVVLESEAEAKSAQTAKFLREHLSDLAGILEHEAPSPRDRLVLRHAALAGEASRYRLYGSDGRVVIASRPEDIGKRHAAPDFESIVREGRGVLQLDRRGSGSEWADALGLPYPEGTEIVARRYEPIMQGTRLLGVIEVYVDLTPLGSRLRAISHGFLAGLLAMLALIGCAGTASLYRNVRERRRSIAQLDEAHRRAEDLAHQANAMLQNLLAAEEEKMRRVVGFVDGLSHEIGNPLATLSMSLDALEASRSGNCQDDCEARIADMREALDRVGAFVHGLTELSFQEGKADSEVDVNEIIRSLAGLVQLDDRTRDVSFALRLSPEIPSLSLARRPVSLSLFIVLNAAAESVHGSGGRIEIETRRSAGGDAVEVRVAAASPASEGRSTGSSREWAHPALDTARRIIEPMGGRMTLSAGATGAHHCDITLPDAGGHH